MSRHRFERSIRLSLAVRHWAITAWIAGAAFLSLAQELG